MRAKPKALVCEGCKKETDELERYQGYRLCLTCSDNLRINIRKQEEAVGLTEEYIYESHENDKVHIWRLGDWRIEWREGREGYVVFPPQCFQYSFGTFSTLNSAKRAISENKEDSNG